MKLTLKTINFEDFTKEATSDKIIQVKKKRERAVYYLPKKRLFFKTWVKNWTQSEITNYGVETGFYNQKNANSLCAVLFDESGPRGYVQHAGESAVAKGKSDKCWEYFVTKTTLDQRKKFIHNILENSIRVKGTYTDLAPSNVIFYQDRINLIDFESFRSFDLIFNSKRADFEKFELDAWWKPVETAKRDANKYIKEYFEKCLDIKFDFNMNSEVNFKKAMNLI